MSEKSRSTIGDKDWKDLQDRAGKANPGTFDDKTVERRKAANENFKNRDWN